MSGAPRSPAPRSSTLLRVALALAVLAVGAAMLLSVAPPGTAGGGIGQVPCRMALAGIRPLGAHFRGTRISQENLGPAWSLGANCAAQLGLGQEALAYAREATGPGASDDAWLERLLLARSYGSPDEIVTTTEHLARTHPAALAVVTSAWMAEMLDARLSAPRDGALKTRLLDDLWGADYRPADPFDDASAVWTAYAASRADQGDLAGASAAFARVSSLRSFVDARLSKQFQALAARYPAQFDLVAAQTAILARARALAAAHPDRAQGVASVAVDLLGLGRPAEAAALIAEARAKAAKDGAFTDWSAVDHPLAELEAVALWRQGRHDDALAAGRRAASPRADGEPDLHGLNRLAFMMLRAGRDAEALAQMQTAAKRGVDTMNVETVRACAWGASPAETTSALAYLAAHDAESPGMHTVALICANDLDGAAASFIHRLGGPQANLALEDLTRWRPPDHPTPVEAERARRLDQLRSRPDVQAAVARVGHLEDLPLPFDAGWWPSKFY